MTTELENRDADWPLNENVKERRQDGTYIPADEPGSALAITVNGSGTLGTGGGALLVEPGTGQVQGSEHTIQSSDDRTLDVDLPGGNDRRDVVYLSDAGTLEVRKGRGGKLAWGDGVAANARTFRNAYRPPPPDLVGIPGLVLAVVTVRSGRNALDSDAIDPVDVRPPDDIGTANGQAIQSALDGRITVAAPGKGVVDAIDPAATSSPVQDAIDVINAVGVSADRYYGSNFGGAGRIYYPPTTIKSPGGITGSGGIRHIGCGTASSVIELTATDSSLFTPGSPADIAQSFFDGLMVSGGAMGDRTSGSAFRFDGYGGNNFNIGHLAFTEWGTDPIIDMRAGHAYGSTWQNILADSYRHGGPVLKASGELLFGMEIGLIGAGAASPNVYTVDLEDTQFGGTIRNINAGGESGRALRVHDTKRSAGLRVGYLNSEPNDPTTTDHIVSLGGSGTCAINHITGPPDLTPTNVVELVASGGTGPANKRIGQIRRSADNASIAVKDAPSAPSYYWGPRTDVDYGGHGPIAVIPLANRGQPAPANLSGVSGNYDGEQRADDGTNTPGRGVLCVWDGTANAGSGAWRKPDGTTFS